jgi:cytochrome c oxidase cbb3-type subunit I/II
MYYFLPKAAERPVYSYRLSIIHFWTLIFLYIWAGPHHLLYSALPDWAQSLGTVFSIMLIAPSWGGMINGLLTLRGSWDKVRENVILKFMVVAITAYGMATFEGPTLSLKNVNAIAHFTDWIIAHVHVGALGWNGFLTFGIMYWLIPKLFNTSLYSKKMANFHFWIGFVGILMYAIPMYWSGIVQALMWKQFTPEGILQYPNFLETLLQIVPMHMIRATGGMFFYAGVIAMVYNLVKTIKQGSFIGEEAAEAPALDKNVHFDHIKGFSVMKKHRLIEKKPLQFTVLAVVAVIIGGLIEVIPTYLIKSNIPTIASVKPYSALELQGRDIYIREACNSCHSQLVRPFRSETERYGEYSKAGEYVYDHPFLWGSKRTGPDLHRIGQKYPNLWHYLHMDDPTVVSPGSLMPRYSWLKEQVLDVSGTESKIKAMRTLGVPYEETYEKNAVSELEKQADVIAKDLQKQGIDVTADKEIIALIAYLQRLGTDIKNVNSLQTGK